QARSGLGPARDTPSWSSCLCRDWPRAGPFADNAPAIVVGATRIEPSDRAAGRLQPSGGDITNRINCDLVDPAGKRRNEVPASDRFEKAQLVRDVGDAVTFEYQTRAQLVLCLL